MDIDRGYDLDRRDKKSSILSISAIQCGRLLSQPYHTRGTFGCNFAWLALFHLPVSEEGLAEQMGE